jgi:hypothetical protein
MVGRLRPSCPGYYVPAAASRALAAGVAHNMCKCEQRSRAPYINKFKTRQAGPSRCSEDEHTLLLTCAAAPPHHP